MDIKEFSKQIKAKRKELDELMKRKMPVLAGRMAKDHYKQEPHVQLHKICAGRLSGESIR